MVETNLNDAILREKLRDVVRHLKNGVYLGCMADSAYAQAIIWASKRIAELEAEFSVPEKSSDKTRETFFRLGTGCDVNAATYCKAVAWGQARIKKLELENENLSKTILTISKSPQLASPESDEEIHQRRRRERMLDEIMLLCVRHDIKHKNDDSTLSEWGNLSRMDALEILSGIESVKNEQE